MKKFLSILTLGAALILPAKIEAQPVGVNRLGVQTPLSGYALPGMTTNQYVPGLTTSANSQGAGMNQFFIGTSGFDTLPLQFSAVQGTNPTALAVPEWITLNIYRTFNNGWPETPTVPTWTISLLSSNNTAASTNWWTATPASVCTNLDVHGCTGVYVESLVSTNAANTATNYVTLQENSKANTVLTMPAN